MTTKNLKGKEAMDREQELVEYAGPDKIVSSHELAHELKQTADSVFKVATGIKSLDRLLGGGVEGGDLVIVTGPTGEGKTSMLMSITKNMAEAGTNSVWFTLEVTPRQFLYKLMRATGEEDEAKMPLFYLPRAGVEEVPGDHVEKWEKKYRRKYETIDWIEDKITEAKIKVENRDGTLKAVFIDHIHMIFSVARSKGNVSLEIGDMVARIKDIALKQNLVVFLIAHSKDPQEGRNREPRKEDIRDSGLISRLADDIIGVWRIKNDNDGTKKTREEIDEDDNKAKVRVFKNRSEGTLGFFTMYHKNHYLTEDFDWDAAQEAANKQVEKTTKQDKKPKGRKDHGADW